METVMLKVTSAFFIGGRMARQGDVVEVPTADAKHLLHRGKAVLATAADEPKLAAQDAGDDDQGGDQAESEAKPASKSRKAK